MGLSEQAEKRLKQTGKITSVVAASATDKNSVMFQAPYYTEKHRGAIPEYDNQFNVQSWKSWLEYDSHASATRLRGKILFVGSEGMALPQGAKEYSDLAKGKVKNVWIGKHNQFEFYDKPELLEKVANHVRDHLKSEMKP